MFIVSIVIVVIFILFILIAIYLYFSLYNSSIKLNKSQVKLNDSQIKLNNELTDYLKKINESGTLNSEKIQKSNKKIKEILKIKKLSD